MALEFEIEWEGEDAEILVLPYERDLAAGRTNHGFCDLRGRPELAAEIAEAAGSPALRALLVKLARPGSGLFTIGCDLASWPPAESGDPHQCAGYLQLAFSDLRRDAVDHRRHLALGRDLKAHLLGAVGDDSWVVRLVVAAINAAEIGGPEQIWSPVVEFSALAANERDAEASAERLIAALCAFVAPDAALR